MSSLSQNLRKDGKTIGLVPTMGALHEGHLSLLERARDENDVVVESIFVNPAQFGPGEDLERYPRDLARDSKLSDDAGVDILFVPDAADVYRDGYRTYVEVEELAEALCGAVRPGHFRGVTTVVLKLFNIIRPNRAYFGRKDYQQFVIIQTMARDLDLDIEIVGCPTVREPDGLAMSSRNAYLDEEERESALALFRSFDVVRELIRDGERNARTIEDRMREFIAAYPHVRSIDYVSCVDPLTLKAVDTITDGTVIAVTAHVGRARLIDNFVIDLER
jgi:pantoate--beta-alanine ligase